MNPFLKAPLVASAFLMNSSCEAQEPRAVQPQAQSAACKGDVTYEQVAGIAIPSDKPAKGEYESQRNMLDMRFVDFLTEVRDALPKIEALEADKDSFDTPLFFENQADAINQQMKLRSTHSGALQAFASDPRSVLQAKIEDVRFKREFLQRYTHSIAYALESDPYTMYPSQCGVTAEQFVQGAIAWLRNFETEMQKIHTRQASVANPEPHS